MEKIGRFVIRRIRFIRKRSSRIDWFFGKIAKLSYFLFGDYGTSLKEIKQEVKKLQAFKEKQQIMFSQLNPSEVKVLFNNKDKPTLTSCRFCDVNEFHRPEIRQRLQALNFDPTDIHRKHWEKAAVAFLVETFGYYNDRSTGLGIGVGRENLLFLFANHCGKVVGIDRYRSESWRVASISPEKVYDMAPFEYRRNRLKIIDMDMRYLGFANTSFDFVWSISSIEHLNSIEDVLKAFHEIARVLKPDGHLFLTTEWNFFSQNPIYEPGMVVFDKVLYPYIVSRLKYFRPLSSLNLNQQDHPAHFFITKWRSASGIEVRPCVNLFTKGTFIVPVLLVFKKV